MMVNMGNVNSTFPTSDDHKTLQNCRFQTGDLICLTIESKTAREQAQLAAPQECAASTADPVAVQSRSMEEEATGEEGVGEANGGSNLVV